MRIRCICCDFKAIVSMTHDLPLLSISLGSLLSVTVLGRNTVASRAFCPVNRFFDKLVRQLSSHQPRLTHLFCLARAMSSIGTSELQYRVSGNTKRCRSLFPNVNFRPRIEVVGLSKHRVSTIAVHQKIQDIYQTKRPGILKTYTAVIYIINKSS